MIQEIHIVADKYPITIQIIVGCIVAAFGVLLAYFLNRWNQKRGGK